MMTRKKISRVYFLMVFIVIQNECQSIRTKDLSSVDIRGIKYGFTGKEYQKSLSITTDTFTGQRSPGLQSLLSKVRDGRLLTMAVIGGSNSAGRDLKIAKKQYFSQIADWWNKHVYKTTGSKLMLSIMGIGGISSDTLLFSLQNYLPKQQPDIVLVEFSVNDYGYEYGKVAQPMELLTRRLILLPSRPLVMYVHLVNPNIINGKILNTNCTNMEDLGFDDLAKHYGIPSVSMKDFVCPLTISGKRKISESKIDMFNKDGSHAGFKSHTKIASMIIEYFKNALSEAPDRPTKIKDNRQGLLVLVKPLFSDPSISDNQLTNAMCWSHITPNWKIPLRQTLHAHVTESRGFAYVSPLMSLKNKTFDRSARHLDGYGGWACHPGKGTKLLTIQFVAPDTNLLLLPSFSVLVRLNYKATTFKMWLNDERRSCALVITETQRRKWKQIRLYPITTQLSPGNYTLWIETRARWFVLSGIVIGYHGYHGYEGYKLIDEKIINCSNLSRLVSK